MTVEDAAPEQTRNGSVVAPPMALHESGSHEPPAHSPTFAQTERRPAGHANAQVARVPSKQHAREPPQSAAAVHVTKEPLQALRFVQPVLDEPRQPLAEQAGHAPAARAHDRKDLSVGSAASASDPPPPASPLEAPPSAGLASGDPPSVSSSGASVLNEVQAAAKRTTDTTAPTITRAFGLLYNVKCLTRMYGTS